MTGPPVLGHGLSRRCSCQNRSRPIGGPWCEGQERAGQLQAGRRCGRSTPAISRHAAGRNPAGRPRRITPRKQQEHRQQEPAVCEVAEEGNRFPLIRPLSGWRHGGVGREIDHRPPGPADRRSTRPSRSRSGWPSKLRTLPGRRDRLISAVAFLSSCRPVGVGLHGEVGQRRFPSDPRYRARPPSALVCDQCPGCMLPSSRCPVRRKP